MARMWLPLTALILCIAGAAVAADALVTTDDERVAQFLGRVSAPHLDGRVEALLAFANLDHVDVRAQADGSQEVFSSGDEAALADWARGALDRFDTDTQVLLQESIEEHGTRRTVTTRLGDATGEATIAYDLVQRNDAWLLTRIRVFR